MKKKRFLSILFALLSLNCIFSISSLSVNAATYSGGYTRGAKPFSWATTTFYWEVNNYEITYSTASQSCGGLGAVNAGTSLTNCYPGMHEYDVHNKIMIGLGRLSFSVPYDDHCWLSNNGSWGMD